MRKTLAILALAAAFALTGCPQNATQQQQLATASDNAAQIVIAAQTTLTTAYNEKLIPQSDYQFIQQEFSNIGHVGLTVDSCIRGASGNSATLTCLDAALTQVSAIGAQGVNIKSTQGQATFNLVVTGVEGVLKALETSIGGTATTPTPQPAPASVS